MKRFFVLFSLMFIPFFQLKAIDFPDIQGWQPVSAVMTYNPENLYEYIDGAADQFLDYGFQLLHSRDLVQNDLKVTVDIYDMGNLLNAFGIYKTERPSDQAGLPIDTEAIISPPYQCLLLKAKYYVKVNIFEGEITDSTGTMLLTAITEALPGQAGFPEELKLLPAQGKIRDSEGFTRVGFLGLTELNNCIQAKYKDNQGKEFQYFIILPLKNIPRETIWKKLSENWKKLEAKGHPLLVRKIPYKRISGILMTPEKLLGVTDCTDESEVIERLEATLKK